MKNKHIFLLTLLIFLAGSITAQTIKAPETKPTPEIKWRHRYDQSLMIKLYLSDVEPVKGEGRQVKTKDSDAASKVWLDFAQTLEVIKKIDNLTLGIPKIVYLVGWQYNGHDSKYPAWHEVNPKLKRQEDRTALQSMKWLMKEAYKYNTTVSVHINMFDAYEDSPLWDTYVENDIIARNTDGSLRPGEWGWPVSYTQEWKTGYAQKRIDDICKMLPLKKAGTVHIDAYHTWAPFDKPGDPISPYLGYTAEQETETQEKIFRYWDKKGIDVTSEGMRFLRISAFEGLQPASWWFDPSIKEYLEWPASYYTGGSSNSATGRLFGNSMHGEPQVKKDPENLSGFLHEFCIRTLPWYYLNRLERLEYTKNGTEQQVTFSEGVVSLINDKEFHIKKNGNYLVRDNDVFVPALWMKQPAIIAYSVNGYRDMEWTLPEEWKNVTSVYAEMITINGLVPFKQNIPVNNGTVKLSLQADEGMVITPII